eukprot:GHVN01063449.1.p1 GENE.GHVN01063449.1~~GHVN01063449.1.p1  ORF type:complete len:150 (-),score=24.25 GHVN01063449.1:267-716(-)
MVQAHATPPSPTSSLPLTNIYTPKNVVTPWWQSSSSTSRRPLTRSAITASSPNLKHSTSTRASSTGWQLGSKIEPSLLPSMAHSHTVKTSPPLSHEAPFLPLFCSLSKPMTFLLTSNLHPHSNSSTTRNSSRSSSQLRNNCFYKVTCLS